MRDSHHGLVGRAGVRRFGMAACAAIAVMVATAERSPTVAAVVPSGLQAEPAPAGLSFEATLDPADPLPPSSYAPHLLRGSYSEAWSYLFSFPNGYTIVSRLTVTNRGSGDGRGAGVALIIDPAGHVVQQVNSRPQDRWTRTLSDEGVDLRVAGQEWSVRPPSHDIRLRSRQARFDIRATGVSDIFRPGRLHYAPDAFLDLTVLAPRLEASGTLQLGDRTVELRDGSGIAFHSYSNRDEQDQATSWLQFHTFDADLQMSLWELTTPEAFDHVRVGFLLLFDRGRLVREQATYQRSYADLERDPESPHYPVPGRLRFGDASTAAEVVLRQRHRLELVDLINSRFVRLLVRRFMEPVSYEFAAAYNAQIDLEGETHQLVGNGVASLQIVDDPPEGRPW